MYEPTDEALQIGTNLNLCIRPDYNLMELLYGTHFHNTIILEPNQTSSRTQPKDQYLRKLCLAIETQSYFYGQ